jgi:5-methylcytosine-specific restriction endonuclease McrA
MVRPKKFYRIAQNRESLQCFIGGEYIGSFSIKSLCKKIQNENFIKDDTILKGEFDKQKNHKLSKQKREYEKVELSARLKVFSVFGGKCLICSYDKVVQIHHINGIEQSVGRSLDDLENLAVLCPNCHALAHQGLLEKKRLCEIVFEKLESYNKPDDKTQKIN